MGFVCENEIIIKGSSEAERKKAADILTALDIIDEGTLSQQGNPTSLVLTFSSADGLVEEEAMALPQTFPGLDVQLIYFSKDGEFFGFSRSGPEGDAAESADLEAKDLEEVGKRYSGDGIGFVRARYSLAKV